MGKSVVIVAAARTAVGSFNGSLAGISATDLGAVVIRDLLKKINLAPEAIDEVILGQVLTASMGQNPARQAVIKAGLPHTTPALTINKVCGSGLKAVHLAAQAIKCGDANVIIAGGQENMSQAPHALQLLQAALRAGDEPTHRPSPREPRHVARHVPGQEGHYLRRAQRRQRAAGQDQLPGDQRG